MKKYNIALTGAFLAILVLLCACGKPAAPTDASQTANTEDLMPHLEAKEVIIEKPKFKSVKTDRKTDKTLVYKERENEKKDRYQDVSAYNNVFAIPAAYAVIGETVTVAPGIFGKVNMCAVDFRLKYDSSQLKYLGCDAKDEALILNGEERGVIKANYLSAENVTKGFDLCELKFQAVTAEACDSVIEIEIVDMVALSGDDIVPCEYSLISGVVHLNPKNG
ncbi:MAG: hypothetical protein IJS65_07800 [Clostridia bacterium]|nr:hypothetical protein [Clostridia bacterium]